jgi:hypothetical protein
MIQQVKVCTTCEESKNLSEFWQKSEIKKDGTRSYRPSCKECEIKKKLKKYHEEGGKEEQKKRSFRALMNSYGISEEVYEQERIKQNYKCLLCGAGEKDQHHGRLYVDHCHVTGKYRGLLCNLCNTGLGAFKDNTEVIQKAIEYLNETSLRHRNQSST